MRVLVVHMNLNACGGGERVCVHVVDALKEEGHTVHLATVSRTDWARVKRMLKPRRLPDAERSLLPFNLTSFGLYQRFATSLLVRAYRRDYDLVVNTHGDVLPIPVDIVYMHFPSWRLLSAPGDYKYRESLLWRIYYTPYQQLTRNYGREAGVILTNSRFSAATIRLTTGRRARIVYPAVRGEDFKPIEEVERRDEVITIGRFSPEKGYERIVQVASELSDVTFHIVGTVTPGRSANYYLRVKRLIRAADLKNVRLHANLPHRELLRLMSRCRVLLHLMRYEHFGLAVAEGMLMHLVPVVHRSGGAWTDIVEFGRYGLGYRDYEEVPGLIERALSIQEKMGPKLRQSVLDRFSYERFKREFLEVVEDAAP